ncbi:MAG TPA: DNA cytosine methyltransferase [Roseiarcus sp.]|nr:DNA cytosine methyltransferase [Roseiarcus sp.]
MNGPSYYEFFCGGGMVRAGLGHWWNCLFANDIDPKKSRAYGENWGEEVLRLGDIHDLNAADLPGRADLAWASFPCQDLSVAGAGQGLAGARSSAFWGFHALMAKLAQEGRAPTTIALENVVGALTSNRGADFVAICGALHELGYRFGALTIDAAHFLPQSRPRLFMLAVRGDMVIGADLAASAPRQPFASRSLLRAHALLPQSLAADWLWWSPANPPRRNLALLDLLERSPSATWHNREETQRLVSILSAHARAELDIARKRAGVQVGALYRRMRPDVAGGRRMRAEARFDGLAGCLRTPGGGSSRQFLLICQDGALRSRLLSAREAARLMGLPDEYKLPSRYNEAYHLVGDGVCVPVVRFLAEHLLEPLSAAGSQHAVAAE